MALAVASEHADEVKGILEKRWRDSLEDSQVEAADIILDFGAEEMTCPACLTSFATGPKECPECGLFLG